LEGHVTTLREQLATTEARLTAAEARADLEAEKCAKVALQARPACGADARTPHAFRTDALRLMRPTNGAAPPF
jgi:uncharacterized membrane protein